MLRIPLTRGGLHDACSDEAERSLPAFYFLFPWLDTMASGVSGFHAAQHRSASASRRLASGVGSPRNEAWQRVSLITLWIFFLSDLIYVPGKFPCLQGPNSGTVLRCSGQSRRGLRLRRDQQDRGVPEEIPAGKGKPYGFQSPSARNLTICNTVDNKVFALVTHERSCRILCYFIDELNYYSNNARLLDIGTVFFFFYDYHI